MVNENELYYLDDQDDKICKYRKARDHCHLSKKYRGADHNIYNLNLKLPQKILVSCHNISGYDTHLYIKDLAKKYGEIYLIASNDENFTN